MNRHVRIWGLISVLAGGLAGCAGDETAQVPAHVGVLVFGPQRQPIVDGLRAGMTDLGYREATGNAAPRGPHAVRYTVRSAEKQRDGVAPVLQALLAERPDVVVVAGGLEADAARDAFYGRDGVPVVAAQSNAIIERRFVDSRAAPGWNVTGIDTLNGELSGKRIELLKALLPKARRVLVMYSEDIDPSRIGLASAREVAAAWGIEIVAREVQGREGLVKALAALKPGEVDAMLLVPHAPIDNAFTDVVVPRAAELGLPVFGFAPVQAELGAVAAYGTGFDDMGRQAARLVDKILRGTPARALPFETPKQYHYVLNSVVAERLGIRPDELNRAQVTRYINTAPRNHE